MAAVLARRMTRRGGRRRRRGQHTDKLWTSRDPHLKDLLTSVLKLNAQRLRILSAATVDTLTMPSDHAVVHALSSELENYEGHLDRLRREDAAQLKTVGSPTAPLVFTMPEPLASLDIGCAQKARLEEYLDRCQPGHEEDVFAPTVSIHT